MRTRTKNYMPKFTVLIKNVLLTNLRVLISSITITLVKSTNVFIFRIDFCRLTNSRVLISNVEIAIITREYFLDFTRGNQYFAVQQHSSAWCSFFTQTANFEIKVCLYQFVLFFFLDVDKAHGHDKISIRC